MQKTGKKQEKNITKDTTENIDFYTQKHQIPTTSSPLPYLVMKKNIQQETKNLKELLKKDKLKENNPEKFYALIGDFFEKNLVDNIIPYWYDTKWSFDGHTETPQQGNIACGYFVSTTLRDVGVQLQRITLAQQAPDEEALTLACGYDVLNIYQYSYFGGEVVQEMRQKLKDGIYFVALPKTHVVFLLKRKNEVFFIHSGKTAGKMRIELVETCYFLKKFQVFKVVPLSNNPLFLDKWWKKQLIVTKLKT